jgi:hypothetical protein
VECASKLFAHAKVSLDVTRAIMYHDDPVVFTQRGSKVRLHVRHGYKILKARTELPTDWHTWPEHQLLRTTMARLEFEEFWRTLVALPMRQFSTGTLNGG